METRLTMDPASRRYVEEMRERAHAGMGELLEGIACLHYTDFPDHVNVGDSAIFLGAWEFFRSHGTSVARIDSVGTLDVSSVGRHGAPYIHGGGNFGGLYGHHERNRYTLASVTPPETPLVQGPQSVVFTDVGRSLQFQKQLALRPGFRMAVRDLASAARLEGAGHQGLLVPDNAHMLGQLPSADPIQDVIVLARTDGERRALPPDGSETVDWMREKLRSKISRHLREDCPQVPMLQSLVRLSNEGWVRLARRRLRFGVGLLSPGRTIVTDRLHAMLMGLQMGRRVVAVDNSNGKLSAYARTWFEALQPPLEFAEDFTHALQLARRTSY